MSLPVVGDLFLDRYRIDAVLGEGGFATVFSASDGMSLRKVALKVLKPDKGTYPEEVVSRFTREVRIVANLRDPHTVTMYDSGTSPSGLLYMVFEHVDGVDLSRLIAARGALPEPEVVHILVQVLLSLREAHRVGLLHRDIKPENIRVYEYGGDPLRVKLLDFGIARPSRTGGTRITRPGELVGTPRYMSPEQLLEQELTPASDLYSLGLVGIEMLLGRSLLHGNTWSDQLARLKDGHHFDTSAVAASPVIRAVITRMVAREAAHRYQSADDVLRDLGAGVSNDALSIPQLPTPPAGPTLDDDDGVEERRTTRKRPARSERLDAQRRTVLALASIASIVLAVLLTVVAVQKYRAAKTRPEPSPPTLRDVSFLKHPAGKPTAAPTPPVAPADEPDLALGVADAGALASGTPGCTNARKPGQGLVRLREVDGLSSHDWPVYVPSGYDPKRPHPSIFLFRDAGQRPEYMVFEAGFDDIADANDVVLIAPPGDEHFDGTGAYFRIWEGENVIEHIRAAWTVAAENLCLDPGRVFAVGHAAGGYAAERMACEFPVAAIASNAHAKVETDPRCTPKRPVPYLVLLGTSDGYAPPQGGLNCALTPIRKVSWKQIQEHWRAQNECRGSRRPWGGEKRDGQCSTWDCAQPFVFCELDGGREWPGARAPMWDRFNADCGGYPSNFPSVPTIWEFFSQVPPRED